MRERKPIDQALRRFLDEQAAAFGVPGEMTDAARAQMLRQRMVRALESRTSIPGLPNEVETHEVEIAAGLRARLYIPPRPEGPLPMLVYLHGGGWVAGSVATHDPFCRLLSGASMMGVLGGKLSKSRSSRRLIARVSAFRTRGSAKRGRRWFQSSINVG